jgi:predicted AlkP superfamily pyrophosphatase or phosphodiesterase
VVVFDGLRPDSVVEEDMPTLYAMSKRGVMFAHHHPVYPSSTEVNGTAIATRGHPTRTGIMSNREYRPNPELMHAIDTEDAAEVSRFARNPKKLLPPHS